MYSALPSRPIKRVGAAGFELTAFETATGRTPSPNVTQPPVLRERGTSDALGFCVVRSKPFQTVETIAWLYGVGQRGYSGPGKNGRHPGDPPWL